MSSELYFNFLLNQNKKSKLIRQLGNYHGPFTLEGIFPDKCYVVVTGPKFDSSIQLLKFFVLIVAQQGQGIN